MAATTELMSFTEWWEEKNKHYKSNKYYIPSSQDVHGSHRGLGYLMRHVTPSQILRKLLCGVQQGGFNSPTFDPYD